MPTLRPAVVALGLLLALATPALPGSLEDANTTIRSGDWQGAAHFDAASGRLTYCAAATKMARGTFLGVMVTRDGEWSLVLSNDGWHLPSGREYPIRLSFDEGPGLRTTSKAVTRTKLEIVMASEATLVALFRAARVLQISSGSFDESFPLTGTSSLLKDLDTCVSDQLARETSASTPPSAEAAPTSQSSSSEAQSPASGSAEEAYSALQAGDYATALRLLSPLAEQGDAWAQYNLGIMYENGDGVPRDYLQAVAWYQKAADQGDAAAKVRLAAAKVRLADLIARQQQAAPAPAVVPKTNSTEVALEEGGGTLLVPVLINGAITLLFTVDSGASDVTIPADVFLTLVRTGTIEDADMLETKTYTLADGSTKDAQTFRIRSLKVGDQVLEKVIGSVSDVNGPLLLGQSFLRNFKSWSIDNSRQVLVLVSK